LYFDRIQGLDSRVVGLMALSLGKYIMNIRKYDTMHSFLGKKLVDMIFDSNKPSDIMKIRWRNGVKKHHINDHMNVHMWVLEHLEKKIFL